MTRSADDAHFVTHLARRDDPLFTLPEPELLARYSADFASLFGYQPEPAWWRLVRVPLRPSVGSAAEPAAS